MTKYEIMFEALQERVNSGELTIEDAQILNDVAYEKYADDDTEYEEVTESSDEGVTYEEYLESMEEELFGEATRLAKEIHKKASIPNRIMHGDNVEDQQELDKSDSLFYGRVAASAKKSDKYKHLTDEIIKQGSEKKTYQKQKAGTTVKKALKNF